MEAANVVQLPPGFKFDPDDDVLVEHYLLPRLRGQPLPFEGIIIEADPLSAPPWKLLDKYKRKDDAFFFAVGQAKSSNGNRQKRTCEGGGCWEGQKCVEGKKLGLAGTGEEIVWRKYALNFHAEGKKGSTGWVMHEYAIKAPAELASSPLRVYRIRFTVQGKKRQREAQDSGGDDAAARAAPRRATALPPLENYPSTSQSSLVVADDEPVLSIDDVILAPMEDCGVADGPAAAANLVQPEDIGELLQYFNYNDLSVPEPCIQQAALQGPAPHLGGGIISPPVPTMSDCIGAPAGTSTSDQGSCTAMTHLDFEMPESIDELLQYFSYDD